MNINNSATYAVCLQLYSECWSLPSSDSSNLTDCFSFQELHRHIPPTLPAVNPTPRPCLQPKDCRPTPHNHIHTNHIHSNLCHSNRCHHNHTRNNRIHSIHSRSNHIHSNHIHSNRFHSNQINSRDIGNNRISNNILREQVVYLVLTNFYMVSQNLIHSLHLPGVAIWNIDSFCQQHLYLDVQLMLYYNCLR